MYDVNHTLLSIKTRVLVKRIHAADDETWAVQHVQYPSLSYMQLSVPLQTCE